MAAILVYVVSKQQKLYNVSKKLSTQYISALRGRKCKPIWNLLLNSHEATNLSNNLFSVEILLVRVASSMPLSFFIPEPRKVVDENLVESRIIDVMAIA